MEVGTNVLLNVKARTKGKNPKLMNTWKGPYLVLEDTPTNLVLQNIVGKTKAPFMVHKNRCIPVGELRSATTEDLL